MLENWFRGVFDSQLTTVISLGDFLACLGTALGLGLVVAFSYSFRCRYTRSFLVTLALLPAVVCVVIMMVNGNAGAGVAVAGAFSLVRFRSVAGTAREICALFLAMAVGLMTGMGYLAFGAVFTGILCLAFVLYQRLDLGVDRNGARYRTLTVTIPEDLDYSGIFEDLFRTYASSWQLLRVKTTNMGSLYKLTYNLTLRDPAREKELLDAMRCRNGNLEIVISCQDTTVTEL